MQSNRKTLVIGGIAAIAAVIFVAAIAANGFNKGIEANAMTYIPKHVLGLTTGDVPPSEDQSASTCGESVDSAQAKVSFKMLTPHVLPEGYSLKAATAQPEAVQLFYFDGNVCGEGNKSLKDGVVKVIAAPLTSADRDAKDGKEYVTKKYDTYVGSGMNATVISLKNGMQAVAYPAGVGTSKTIDENNRVIMEDNYDYAASIYAVDDTNHAVYRVQAFLPLEDLVSIAGSLQ
ncbi:MAG TPA: hypothetical protein VF016_02715 [Nitrososphaera sp.]